MKHEGSRQVGGYRSGDIPVQSEKVAGPRTHAKKPRARRNRKPTNHNRRFHEALAELRRALWNDDTQSIPHLERRIDNIVNEWEPHP